MQPVLNVPKFGIGGVPIETVAKVMGKEASFVRAGIEAGWLPIGVAVKGEKRTNYYVSPLKLWEFTGYIYKGEEDEE